MLRVDALTVEHDGIVAVDGCSTAVAGGRVLAVLGANGAGKSTLLATIACTVRQRSGSIEWEGRRIDGWPAARAARAGIALVPEGRRLFARLSVRENLLVGAARLRGREVDGALGEVLDCLPELARRLDVPAARLSGGEQQMLAVGRALVGRPRLLLLDELSTGLSPAVVRRLHALIGELTAQGVAAIVVEEQAETVLAHADAVLVLERGRTVFQGTPDELRARPGLLGVAYLGRSAPDTHELVGRAPREEALAGPTPERRADS